MEVTNVVIVAVGFSGLIAVLALYLFDPLKRKPLKLGVDMADVAVMKTTEAKPGRTSQLRQKQAECSPLGDFIRGGRKITFVGPTLDVVLSQELNTLKKAAGAKETKSLEFILLDPKVKAPLQKIAERRKGDTTVETVQSEIYRSLTALNELRESSQNPDKISVRLMEHVPLLSIVAVDPTSPTGKIRTSTHRDKITSEERPVDDLYPDDSFFTRDRKYGVALDVYDLAVKHSSPIETKLDVRPPAHPQ